VFDVGLAGVEQVDLGRIDIKSEGFVAFFSVSDHQGEPDVTQTDDTDHCGFFGELLFESLNHGYFR
jgi:hypothetical protein